MCVCGGGGGGGGGLDRSQEGGGQSKNEKNLQNLCTHHIVFVTIYISSQKGH